MEALLWVVMVLVVGLCDCDHNVGALHDQYDHYDMGQQGLCEGGGREEMEVWLAPWKAAIIRYNVPCTSCHRSLHRCKVVFRTQEDFGLMAVVEEMRVRGNRDPESYAWMCDGDYLKLSSVGSSLVSSVLSALTPYRSKTTKKLCGLRSVRRPLFTEVGYNVDSFTTTSNNLEVLFHQSQAFTDPTNNSFTMVITTFQPLQHSVIPGGCGDKLQCGGRNPRCVGPNYHCDSHYNCIGGSDESYCKKVEFHSPFISTTTTIIVTLAGIVAACFLLGLTTVLVRKVWGRRSGVAGTDSSSSSSRRPSAPPAVQRQHTLPTYETVMLDTLGGEEGKTSPPPSPEAPPSYNSLYPSGPPPPTC